MALFILGDRQRTDSGNCDLGEEVKEEDELWFPGA